MIRSAIALTAIFAASALITPGGAWPQSDWNAPADAKALKNPVKGIGDARNAIATSCAACHGANGRGDGVASAALQPKPLDWFRQSTATRTGSCSGRSRMVAGPCPPGSTCRRPSAGRS